MARSFSIIRLKSCIYFWFSVFSSLNPFKGIVASDYIGHSGVIRIGSKPTGLREHAYDTLSRNYDSNSLLVIDDLPRLDGNDGVTRRILSLMNVFDRYGHRILVTSNYEFPQTMLGKKITCQEVPPFNKEDIQQLLMLMGGTKLAKRDGVIDIIVGLTKGNGTLIIALLNYLKTHNWNFSQKEFEDLLKEKYKLPLTDKVITHLVKSVDSQSRELLYRLDLTFGGFSEIEISLVSQVDPTIQYPNEKFNCLKGLWIQKESDNLFVVSPLVKSFGKQNLPPERQRAVHSTLGIERIYRKRKNQWDSYVAVCHFILAEDYTKAATTLVLVLQTMMCIEQPFDDAGLGLIWSNEEIPSHVPLGLRVYLRALQISTNIKLKRDIDYLIEDFCELLESITDEDSWALIGSGLILSSRPEFAENNIILLIDIIFKGIIALPDARCPDGSRFPSLMSSHGEVGEIILFTLIYIKKTEPFLHWLKRLHELDRDIIHKVSHSKISYDYLVNCCDVIWLAEHEKDEKSQDWDKLFCFYEYVAEGSLELNFYTLWGCAIRAQIIIAAEYQDSLEKAEKIALVSLEKIKGKKEDSVEFLIKNIIGYQYYYKYRYHEATKYLEESITFDGDIYPTGKLRALHYLSIIYSKESTSKAKEYSEKATIYAKTTTILSESLDVIRAIVELGIATWLNGDDLKVVYRLFDEAIIRLLEKTEKNSIFYKALFMSIGHAAGYLMSHGIDGKPPKQTSGGEPYIPPFRGMFYAAKEEERAALFDESSADMIMVQMALWAEAVSEEKSALFWAEKAKSSGLGRGTILSTHSLYGIIATPDLLNNNFVGCMQKAQAAGECFAIYMLLKKNSIKNEDLNKKVDDLLGSKPNDNWTHAELYSNTIGFLPAAIRVFYVSLSDSAKAIEMKECLIQTAKEIQNTASCPLLWKMSAELIEDIFDPDISALALNKRIDVFKQHEFSALHVVTYCGLSIKKDLPIKRKLEYQLAVIPWIIEQSSIPVMMQRKIIIPFFEEFWLKVFAEQRFQFNTPRMVEEDLNIAKQLNEKDRLYAILKTMADFLGVLYKGAN